MFKKNSSIDVIDKILDACYKHNPDALFIMSLMHQYEERGSLSKKQLQGLHSKASKIEKLHGAKLATLEALIKKMPTRFKSELPETKPMFEKNNLAGELIDAILSKYPQHKRVLFFKSKFDNNEVITLQEMDELKKFKQVLKL